MDEYFEIITGEYIFDCIIEKNEEFIEIYFGNTKMRRHSCIYILIEKGNNIATLESLRYGSNCELNGKLESEIGTILMLKTALKFVFDKYKFLKAIDYYDKAQKDRINIIPKNLLLGIEPWYVKHFGAKPNDASTRNIINEIKKINITSEDLKEISKRTWGTDEDIDKFCNKYNLPFLIGTYWIISKLNIMTYDIFYEIRKIQKGGGKIKEKLRKILRKAERSYYSTMHL